MFVRPVLRGIRPSQTPSSPPTPFPPNKRIPMRATSEVQNVVRLEITEPEGNPSPEEPLELCYPRMATVGTLSFSGSIPFMAGI